MSFWLPIIFINHLRFLKVEFGEKNRKETTFHLLHLSLLREYLDLEFTPLKKSLPFHYDLERVIDDWVYIPL